MLKPMQIAWVTMVAAIISTLILGLPMLGITIPTRQGALTEMGCVNYRIMNDRFDPNQPIRGFSQAACGDLKLEFASSPDFKCVAGLGGDSGVVEVGKFKGLPFPYQKYRCLHELGQGDLEVWGFDFAIPPPTNELHNEHGVILDETYDGVSSGTNAYYLEFRTNTPEFNVVPGMKIKKVVKAAGDPTEIVELWCDADTIKLYQTASFVGDTATFNPPVVVDSECSSSGYWSYVLIGKKADNSAYSPKWNSQPVLPIFTHDIEWGDSGVCGQGESCDPSSFSFDGTNIWTLTDIVLEP